MEGTFELFVKSVKVVFLVYSSHSDSIPQSFAGPPLRNAVIIWPFGPDIQTMGLPLRSLWTTPMRNAGNDTQTDEKNRHKLYPCNHASTGKGPNCNHTYWYIVILPDHFGKRQDK